LSLCLTCARTTCLCWTRLPVRRYERRACGGKRVR
jgi:hypothetical protein